LLDILWRGLRVIGLVSRLAIGGLVDALNSVPLLLFLSKGIEEGKNNSYVRQEKPEGQNYGLMYRTRSIIKNMSYKYQPSVL